MSFISKNVSDTEDYQVKCDSLSNLSTTVKEWRRYKICRDSDISDINFIENEDKTYLSLDRKSSLVFASLMGYFLTQFNKTKHKTMSMVESWLTKIGKASVKTKVDLCMDYVSEVKRKSSFRSKEINQSLMRHFKEQIKIILFTAFEVKREKVLNQI